MRGRLRRPGGTDGEEGAYKSQRGNFSICRFLAFNDAFLDGTLTPQQSSRMHELSSARSKQLSTFEASMAHAVVIKPLLFLLSCRACGIQKKDRTPRKGNSPPAYVNLPKTGNIDTAHSRQCPDTCCGVSALLYRVAVGVLHYGGLYRDPTIRTGACRRGRPSTTPQEGQPPHRPTPTHPRQTTQPSLAPMPRHQLWGLCPTVPSGSRGLALWWLVQGPHNQDWCLPSRQTANQTPRRTTSPPPYTNPPKTDNINHRSRQCPDTSCGVSALNKQTNKHLRCGNRKGLLGRNDQTHHRMGPKTMESTPPIKRNTQAYNQQITRRIYLFPNQAQSKAPTNQPT